MKWLIIIIALIGGIGGVFVTERVFSKLEVSDVKTVEVTQTSAKILWKTNKSTSGKVAYGTDPEQLTKKISEVGTSTHHQLVLTGLSTGTTYYYIVIINEKIYKSGETPYQFTTLPKEGIGKPTPSVSTEEPDFSTSYGNRDPRFDVDKDQKVTVKDWLLKLQQNEKP